jgi:hypothetical protein
MVMPIAMKIPKVKRTMRPLWINNMGSGHMDTTCAPASLPKITVTDMLTLNIPHSLNIM